ncbi:DUF5819 family protein [Streptomyces sp. NPDC006289]|uniref:DUF5819 family protein n=1 Tax=Streptomyces sp. NPDC006289 TaxID=3156744 RepID=UPI0033A726B8
MDADHGGRAGGEKKLSWPGATNRPDAARNSGLRLDRDAEPPGAQDAGPDAAPHPDPAGSGTDAGEGEPPAGISGGTADVVPEPGALERATAAAEPGHVRGESTGSGMSGLSLPYQVAAAIALSVMGVLACGHVAMIFLHVAPSNTLTKQHGQAVDDWVYPEFEQNWKLFAPNPLQQNISVQVRAEVGGAEGRSTTRWIDLSREDGAAIRGNVLPSHVDQNELRRAWDFFKGSHDSENRPNGMRGELSERYIRRIVMLRLAEHDYGGAVERIQVRSAVRSVGAPSWSDEKISTEPDYRELPWWIVRDSDLPRADTDTDPTADNAVTTNTPDQASRGAEAEK